MGISSRDFAKAFCAEYEFKGQDPKTAKSQFANYLSNTNLSAGQKNYMYLKVGGYSLDKAGYQSIIDYVVSLPISLEEKYTFFENAGMRVDRDKGMVYPEKSKKSSK